nr:DNA repair helicase XPB1-like [Tanacetum cinerariifolium]
MEYGRRPNKKQKLLSYQEEDYSHADFEEAEACYSEESDEDDREGKTTDFTKLELKPDHANPNCGKVKLVLKKNRYLLESPFPEVLERLSSDQVISQAIVLNKDFTLLNGRKEFEIDPAQVEHVKQRCLPNALNYSLLEEYDFYNDTVNPKVEMELKPQAQPRPYQEKCLSRMFGNGRA